MSTEVHDDPCIAVFGTPPTACLGHDRAAFDAFVTVLTGRVYAQRHSVPATILAVDAVRMSAKVEIRSFQDNLDFFQR